MADLSDLDKMYRKGFVEGASSSYNSPLGTITILGYNLDKLIEIVRYWESRQSKKLYTLDCESGSLSVEEWPEGHVVWANGKIIWRSWEQGNE